MDMKYTHQDLPSDLFRIGIRDLKSRPKWPHSGISKGHWEGPGTGTFMEVENHLFVVENDGNWFGAILHFHVSSRECRTLHGEAFVGA